MKTKKLIIIGITTVTVNLVLAAVVLAQSAQSSVSVNRLGSLSFAAIPSSFDFGATNIPSIRTPTVSDGAVTSGNSLPADKKLSVQDTRGQGGFSVTLSADGNFTDATGDSIPVSNTAPNDNLRVVTSPLISGITGATTTNGIVYESGFEGPQTVETLVGTSDTDFSFSSMFTNVQNNILDTQVPVDILNGSLPANQGRVGKMSVGVSAMLTIPAFQASGQYMTTLTWTLSDSTTT